MKYDEPKVYKVYTTRNEGAFGFCEGADPTDIELEHESVYLKLDADKFIAELKSENKMLKEHIANGDVSRITWIDEVTELKAENESLKAKLETVNELVKTSKDLYDHAIESLKATHDAEMMDAGMCERRLRRALYKACANWAHFAVAFFSSYVTKERWRKMENKCLKKAEEYK